MGANMKFKVVLEKDEEGWYVATVPSLRGCISQGKTEREALKNIREAISLHLQALAEDGEQIVAAKKTKATVVSVSI